MTNVLEQKLEKRKEITDPALAAKEVERRMAEFKNGENPHSAEHKQEIKEVTKAEPYSTEIVDLPSGGRTYPPDSPLSMGTVELRHMTLKDEDILTTESYIKKGVVLDKLFQSLIVSDIDYDSMLVGDRDAIMIAARRYGYGDDYVTTVESPSGVMQKVGITLSDLENKPLDEDFLKATENLFTFKTMGGNVIKFSLLTNGDQKEIKANLKRGRRVDSRDVQLSTRIFQMVKSIDGNEDRKYIKMFLDNHFRAFDSIKLREYIAKIQPGINMEIRCYDEDTGEPFRTEVAIGLDFFWPNVKT